MKIYWPAFLCQLFKNKNGILKDFLTCLWHLLSKAGVFNELDGVTIEY